VNVAHADRAPLNADVKLVRYDAARMALAEAHRVDEVKDIRNKAVAIAAYAKQANDTEMIEWATEIRVRAERRAGELLAAMEKNEGAKGVGPIAVPAGHRNQPPTLAELGINKKQSSRWQQLAAVKDDEFEKAVEAAKEVAREVTTTHVLKLAASRRERSRNLSPTEEEFSESVFIARCVLALRNLIADWPEDRPIAPLIQQLQEHLAYQARRRGAA
jgi:hypothetical protein